MRSRLNVLSERDVHQHVHHHRNLSNCVTLNDEKCSVIFWLIVNLRFAHVEHHYSSPFGTHRKLENH